MAETSVQLKQNSGVVGANGHSPVQKSEIRIIPNSELRRAKSFPKGIPNHEVVHVIPGRVRLRVPRLHHDAGYAQRLRVLLEADSLVTSIRINRAAASVAVTYNSGAVAATKMHSHLIHLLQAASEVIVLKSFTQPATTNKDSSGSSWKFSALATTLAVLGGPIGLPIPPLIVTGTIAAATLPVAQRAIAGIRSERKLNIDFLDLMAIAITTCKVNFSGV